MTDTIEEPITHVFPPVYSQTAKGQTQEWTIEVQGSKFRTREGMVGGKITESQWTICAGKNPGKANATTGEEQALKEAKAKHVKKLESGSLDPAAAGEAKFFAPMLAQKWRDHKDKVQYPAFVQPKLDGMRCVVSEKGMFSRKGKPILSAPHILESLKPVFAENPGLTFDGELYNHDLKANFEKIISLAKKQKPTAAELAESAEKLEYHIYDLHVDGQEMSFEERHQLIWKLVGPPPAQYLMEFTQHSKKFPRIVVVRTVRVSEEGVPAMDEEFVGQGYEGTMVRWGAAPYQKDYRSFNLQKVKSFTDEEFELVDLEEGKGNRAGLATRAIGRMKDGRTFEAGVMGVDAYSRGLLANKAKYIGQQATFVYQNLTSDGKPRMGKLKIIRNYE